MLNTETVNQAYLFIIFILNGILIGLIFDIFRIMRKSFKTPNFLTHLEDTVFWILTAFIILYSLFIFNNGQFRMYVFIGVLLGISVYMLFFSKTIINISVKILKFIKRIFLKTYQIILYPVKIIYKFINSILIKPIQHIYIKFDKTVKKNKIKTKNHRKKKDFNTLCRRI